MATKQLNDNIVKSEPTPKAGLRIIRDSRVRGFGLRILPSGTRAFILDYTKGGTRRVFTLGKFPEWKTDAARKKAEELKAAIKYRNADPASEAAAAREAPTVAVLCDRFKEDHLPKLRASTRRDYTRMLDKDILPKLGRKKVEEIRRKDIEDLHRGKTAKDAPSAANFLLALCSKLFSIAVAAEWIAKNPAKGIPKNHAEGRSRYLSKEEIVALTKALASHSDQNMADIFRLLLLTGARKGEVQSAAWTQLDMAEGIWTKPSSHTKQRKVHRVPLAAPAQSILSKRRDQADKELERIKAEIKKADPVDVPALQEWKHRVETFVFPAPDSSPGHSVSINKHWDDICDSAKIPRKGPKATRIHDLRHTAASILASGGVSLPLIGQLLGHSQPGTTARYAHLFDDSQRKAVEKLGAIVSGKPSAKIMQFKGKRS